jgi:hypothetical protein
MGDRLALPDRVNVNPCSPGLSPFTRSVTRTPPGTSLSVAVPTTFAWASSS